jgi:hypothetical protein
VSFGNQLNTKFVLLHLLVEQVGDKFRIVTFCSTHPEIQFDDIYSKNTEDKSKKKLHKDVDFNSLSDALHFAIELKNKFQSQIFVIKQDDYEQFLPCLVVIE